MLGYDVSHHNPVDVVQHLTLGDVVVIKCSEGVKYRDASCMKHMENWAKEGYAIGLYHFVRIDTDNKPEDEMNDFADAVTECISMTGISIEFLALDIEGTSLNKSNAKAWMSTAVNKLRDKFPKTPVLIYVQASRAEDFQFLCTNYERTYLWIADWTSGTIEKSAGKYGFDRNKVAMWQTGSTKSDNGYTIDINDVYESVLFGKRENSTGKDGDKVSCETLNEINKKLDRILEIVGDFRGFEIQSTVRPVTIERGV